jgi:serine/threonine protein kinase
LTSAQNSENVQSKAFYAHSGNLMVTATKAGRYEIVGELGRGGMGVVYRAKDPLIGRTVALKTVKLSEEGTGMSHAELVDRFQNEARAAGLLTHPNIVLIYDAGETDGLCYIAMELINGKSLQSLLDSGQKFSLPRLLLIIEQVCAALQFAHDNKVVHRDIKPANIMLAADDLVKVTDFGTAKILQYGSQHQTSATGTPSYMSPEQIKGKAVDGRTDIFSLGVMLYEMTTGQKPFVGQDVASVLYRILNEEPLPPQKLDPGIPLGVSSTILKALAKSPHLRYETCRELLDDLKNYRPGEIAASIRSAPALSQPPPPPSIREKPDKNYYVETPRIPGVPPRSNSAAPARPKGAPPSSDSAGDDSQADTGQQISGVYAGPPPKSNLATIKRIAAIAAGVLLVAMLGSYAVKMISGTHQSDSDALPPRQESVRPDDASSTPAPSPEAGSASRPLYASQSNPEIAAASELAQPWSSKKFFYRSLTLSTYVPALIIRLPGPAAQSKSYWAFSLEAPFSQCQLEYIDDLAKLSSDYAFAADHPMVVNPCSHTVFDPLHLKEIPGNIFVRGAIVQGNDPRPPYGIEVKVTANQIRAVAME